MTDTTTTAAALAEAERALKAAVCDLDALLSDTQSAPASIAASIATAKELVAICERRATTARNDHMQAKADVLRTRYQKHLEAAEKLDGMAANADSAARDWLLLHFVPGKVEIIMQGGCLEAQALRQRAAHERGYAEQMEPEIRVKN